MEAPSKSREKRPGRPIAGLWSLDDLDALARAYLPRAVWSWAGGSSERSIAYGRNEDGFARLAIRPLIADSRAPVSMTTELFGRTYSAPFGIAPMGGVPALAKGGDTQLAAAAKDAGIPHMLSGAAGWSWEEARAAGFDPWAQLYMPGDAATVDAMVDRVAASGADILAITVDLPMMANAAHARREGWNSPLRLSPRLAIDCALHPRWLFSTGLPGLLPGGARVENLHPTIRPRMFSLDAGASPEPEFLADWGMVERVRRRWRGTLLLKGVLHPAVAWRAKEVGIDGVIVSNHGGRAIDYACGSLDALPAVVAAAGDMPVLVDGGFRRGSHVLMALALGARMVFLGRPMLFACALAGEAGVAQAIDILREELRRNLAHSGVRSIDRLSPAILTRAAGDDFPYPEKGDGR